MDKDKSQLNQHGSFHNEKGSSDSALRHVSNGQDQEQIDQEAEMDALEARLFAMAKSHS
jgi:archaellum component FlaC